MKLPEKSSARDSSESVNPSGAERTSTPTASTVRTSATSLNLREKFAEIIGADRWVESSFPAVEPVSAEEVARFLKGYPGVVMVVGSGSSFPADFKPAADTVVILTHRLRQVLDLAITDQILEVSSGWSVFEINKELEKSQFIIPALARFNKGTVGGRLAGISARPQPSTQAEGWIPSLLALQVVTPGGEVLNLGSRCLKDVAGYDLRQIYTGSRGAIGVITQAIFRYNLQSQVKTVKSFRGGATRRFDTQWKRLFDPTGRMHPGA